MVVGKMFNIVDESNNTKNDNSVINNLTDHINNNLNQGQPNHSNDNNNSNDDTDHLNNDNYINNNLGNNLNTTNDIDFFNDDNEVNIDFYKKKIDQDKLDNEKSLFIKHLEKKIYGIEKRMRYINHKYVDYYNYYKRLNGIVIFLSASLTLFEASTNIIDYNLIESYILKMSFQMLPLLVSTMVSLIATYIKFQKYQENMERLIVTEEKGIIAISKLKKIREIVYFDIQELKEVKANYLEETYQFYNEVNIKISIELDENDYKKYYKRMSDVDIEIGNTYVNKTKRINNIVDRHIEMENKYEDDFDLNVKDSVDIKKRNYQRSNNETHCVSP